MSVYISNKSINSQMENAKKKKKEYRGRSNGCFTGKFSSNYHLFSSSILKENLSSITLVATKTLSRK